MLRARVYMEEVPWRRLEKVGQHFKYMTGKSNVRLFSCSPSQQRSSAANKCRWTENPPDIDVVFSDVYFPEWVGACARVHPQPRGVPLL